MTNWSVKPDWPESMQPTSNEFVRWFLRLKPLEQLNVVETLLQTSRDGMMCYMQDHKGTIKDLKSTIEYLKEEIHKLVAVDK